MKIFKLNVLRIFLLLALFICCMYFFLSILSSVNRNYSIYSRGVTVKAKLVDWKKVYNKGNDYSIKYQFEYPESSGVTYEYSHSPFYKKGFVSIPPNDFDEVLKTRTVMVRLLEDNPKENYPLFKQRYFIGDINTNIKGYIIISALELLVLLIVSTFAELKLINEWKMMTYRRPRIG